MNQPPEFTTRRLILRSPAISDAVSYQKYFPDPEVLEGLADTVPIPYPEDGALTWLRDHILPKQGHNHWSWGLYLISNPNELIGMISLWRPGTPEHRGFWLAKPYWGQGLMLEACDRITDYAFDELGFESLVFSNAVGNHRSARIKEKMGCKECGRIPGRFVSAKFTEQQLWELSKSQWQTLRNRKDP